MRRDFGLHYTAWFLIGTPFLLVAGLRLKASGHLFRPEISGAAVFVYGFLMILGISFVCAVLDFFVIGTIVHWFKKRRRIKHQTS